jgi:Cu/Ag efflux pump CusA
MRWLVALSLRNSIVVVALGVLLVVAAARTLRTTPLDVFPEFAPPLVEVQTEAPGLSTNEVESLVTVPLEAALNGIPGLDRIRSKSVLGLSSVVLILDPASDVMTARQMVQERLSRAASQLPAVAPAGHAVAPVIAQPRDEDRADI